MQSLRNCQNVSRLGSVKCTNCFAIRSTTTFACSMCWYADAGRRYDLDYTTSRSSSSSSSNQECENENIFSQQNGKRGANYYSTQPLNRNDRFIYGHTMMMRFVSHFFTTAASLRSQLMHSFALSFALHVCCSGKRAAKNGAV